MNHRNHDGWTRWLGGLLAILAAILLCPRDAEGQAPTREDRPAFRVNPDNPKYFLFRGRPLVLVTASEHYGSVINRPFNYAKYLDDLADKKMTLTRTFLLYRELQTPRNPWSPCKPDSPDYIAPYPRTGPGKALDGEPVYDLDRWNPEYFARLRDFLQRASDRGIVVELTLFSHTYSDAIWALNPLRAANNKQGVGKGEWPAYDSLKEPVLNERQEAYARKVVRETCGFDNIYYEICNEPAGNVPGHHVTTADGDAWLERMAGVVREELKRRGRQRLVFGGQAFDRGKLRQDFEKSFAGPTWDAINVHPHTYLFWKGRPYRMGGFMARDLTLAAVRDFCQALYPERKPLVLDEDNAASMYCDPTGWTIHRKRAWAAVLGGAHYDFIDFSVTVGREAGTPESRRAIRTWMKDLSEFIHSFDFIHARPLPGWVTAKPAPLVDCTLAAEGKDYAVYLADAREITDPAAGEAVEGSIEFNLPAGTFRVRFYSPTTGLYSPAVSVEGGKGVRVELPSFRHDLVVRVTRVK